MMKVRFLFFFVLFFSQRFVATAAAWGYDLTIARLL